MLVAAVGAAWQRREPHGIRWLSRPSIADSPESRLPPVLSNTRAMVLGRDIAA
jgi:hypothetical protein